ncbi:zinc-binding dehydrogenase family protein [Mycobacterium avium subsp. avium 2285 (R)]|nr:zinc-binding dehydrogenase family protein [Mycobacterium avium subsp. avium 2285 (R)]
MAALLTALTYDGVPVVAVDQLPEKLAAARRLGAHQAYTPQQAVEARVKAAVVIEAVGHPAALQTAIDLTAPAGVPSPSACRRRTRGSRCRRWVLWPRAGR